MGIGGGGVRDHEDGYLHGSIGGELHDSKER